MHATVPALLAVAATFGVVLARDGERILLMAEPSAPEPPAALVEVLREHKPMLMAYLMGDNHA